MWYNVGMDLGNWITLGAVVVALVIGVASLCFTRSLQKEEHKQRLLKELFEWALDIEKSTTKRRTRERRELWDARQKYISSEVRSDYMKRIASGDFPGLSNHLKEIIVKLNSTKKATEEALGLNKDNKDLKQQNKVNTEELVGAEDDLRGKIGEVLLEIAKIRSKK